MKNRELKYPPIYASVVTKHWFTIPEDHCLARSWDITFTNVQDIPNGAYRRVDRHYLAWIRKQIHRRGFCGLKSIKDADLLCAIRFYNAIMEATGLILENDDAPPNGYLAPRQVECVLPDSW